MISQTDLQPIYSDIPRPLPLRLAIRAGEALHRCGLRDPDFSEDTILRAAQRRTGLSDFGDEGFRVPLRLLLEDFSNDDRLCYLNRWMVRQRCVRLASSRLLIQDELKRHPEIAAFSIKRPLFVVGFPRTGTTLLYNLLAQDPRSRPLLTWESIAPAISEKDERKRIDPRIRRAQRMVRGMNYLAPRLQQLHVTDPLGPEECGGLLANTLMLAVLSDGPGYQKWLVGLSREDKGAAYCYYRQQLQALQRHRSADHWILKSPAHLFALDALVDVFPDACIVQTHRDPLEVVPSGCSLITTLLSLLYEHLDLRQASNHYLNLLLRNIECAMKARQSISPARIIDVHFDQLMEDPIDCVRRIYQHFDYEVSSEMERGMQLVLQSQPRHKHGVHRYTLEQFGLDADAIKRGFAPYCEHYHVRSPRGAANLDEGSSIGNGLQESGLHRATQSLDRC